MLISNSEWFWYNEYYTSESDLLYNNFLFYYSHRKKNTNQNITQIFVYTPISKMKNCKQTINYLIFVPYKTK